MIRCALAGAVGVWLAGCATPTVHYPTVPPAPVAPSTPAPTATDPACQGCADRLLAKRQALMTATDRWGAERNTATAWLATAKVCVDTVGACIALARECAAVCRAHGASGHAVFLLTNTAEWATPMLRICDTFEAQYRAMQVPPPVRRSAPAPVRRAPPAKRPAAPKPTPPPHPVGALPI